MPADILQLQDDWECVGPPDYLMNALRALQSFPAIGCVICRSHPARGLKWSEREVPGTGARVRVFENEPSKQLAMVGESSYTDWPHLKTRAFVTTIGPYRERVKMWDCELDYARRVNAQSEYVIADLAGTDAFRHIGAELSYNRGARMAQMSMALSKYPITRHAVVAARSVRRRLTSLKHPAAD